VLVDIDDLHGNVAHGSHMASLAGSVMAVQWGFAGMTWRGGKLGFRPVMPDAWDAVAFRLLWRGRLIEIEMRPSGTRYRLLQGDPLEISHFGAPYMLTMALDLEGPPELDRVT
jgi:alpha,alpha-trehalose phosphorylase